jgi:hypothetical protein
MIHDHDLHNTIQFSTFILGKGFSLSGQKSSQSISTLLFFAAAKAVVTLKLHIWLEQMQMIVPDKSMQVGAT